MSQMRRLLLCGLLLTFGLAAHAGLESLTKIDRPPLLRPLATISMDLGDWVGHDEPINAEIVRRAQTSEYLNRVYVNRKDPSKQLWLWINFSNEGLNLRHSPEVCLPSGGWTKVESLCGAMPIRLRPDKTLPIMRLGYAQGELVQQVGFWYYIFGEGRLERYVRHLPITSRSSHGRTTRGSGLTVEVFCPGENDPEAKALEDFAQELLVALEPVLPRERAEYYVP